MKNIIASLLLCVFALAFIGCADLKLAAPAPGQDAVVIQAESAQTLSHQAFKEIINWELTHRASLPVEVSRAVDQVRADFPPLWIESRLALANYKTLTGGASVPASRLTQITAALTAATTAMRNLRVGEASEIAALLTAFSQLTQSVRVLANPTP